MKSYKKGIAKFIIRFNLKGVQKEQKADLYFLRKLNRLYTQQKNRLNGRKDKRATVGVT